MIIKAEEFGYGKDILLIYLKNGLKFLFQGYQVVLTKKTYDLTKDSSNLENIIRDDIYNEAVILLNKAALANRNNQFLKFSFYNENRDTSSTDDVKRFDISLNYDSASYLGDIIIECKRLSRNTKNKAYIDNGINRFITNRYGNGLPIGGMIGFIELGEVKRITEDLTTKINSLDSTTQNFEELKPSSSLYSAEDGDYRYSSSHARNHDLEDIDIYHLIVDFTSIIS